jgi:hypothetical protein
MSTEDDELFKRLDDSMARLEEMRLGIQRYQKEHFMLYMIQQISTILMLIAIGAIGYFWVFDQSHLTPLQHGGIWFTLIVSSALRLTIRTHINNSYTISKKDQ